MYMKGEMKFIPKWILYLGIMTHAALIQSDHYRCEMTISQ